MSTALFEHSFYIGGYMSGILYGVELMLYYSTMKALLGRTIRSRSDRFFMIYSTIMLLLLTIDISTNAVWAELMWIKGRNGPGGVPGYIVDQIACWYQAMGSSTVVALVFMGDALLIYRCYIFWACNWYIIALPILIYLGAFSLAVCELVQAYEPGGDFFAGEAVDFGTPYYAMDIGLNVILTVLIVGRLLYMSRNLRQTLGHEGTDVYTSVASIMVESAAPYSIVGIMFLVPYAMGSDISLLFGQVWAKLTVLAPQLIILRMAKKEAWNRETVMNATTRYDSESETKIAQHEKYCHESLPVPSISTSYGEEINRLSDSKKIGSVISLPIAV